MPEDELKTHSLGSMVCPHHRHTVSYPASVRAGVVVFVHYGLSRALLSAVEREIEGRSRTYSTDSALFLATPLSLPIPHLSPHKGYSKSIKISLSLFTPFFPFPDASLPSLLTE